MEGSDMRTELGKRDSAGNSRNNGAKQTDYILRNQFCVLGGRDA